MLRRQKKSFTEAQRLMDEKIKKYEEQSTEKLSQIEKKKKKCEELKNQMIEIKKKN